MYQNIFILLDLYTPPFGKYVHSGRGYIALAYMIVKQNKLHDQNWRNYAKYKCINVFFFCKVKFTFTFCAIREEHNNISTYIQVKH